MKKEKIIEILENFKPDSGYCCRASYEELVNERINSRLDDIIEFIKREPDDWIKCSEKMPENGKGVLVAIKEDGYTDICVGETFGGGNWMINGEHWYEKSDPAIIRWMPLPEIPKEDN